MLALAVIAFGLQTMTPASDARQVTLSAPQAIAEIDAGKMKGDLVRLAWSPDGTEFYLQALERDGHFNVKSMKHYIVSAATKAMKSVDQEPAWASKYWAWKSGQASPADQAFKIAVDERHETKRSTSAPMGGALAKGGGVDPNAGSTNADAASAAENRQEQTIYALRVRRDTSGNKMSWETIGEWSNEPVMPGVNFTWAPAPMALIAFAKRDGGSLMLLDEAGHKQELTGAKSAVLPAWSNDGKRLAWLERKDRKKYELMTAEISAK